LLIAVSASAKTKKVIVAYFSASGITEGVAKELAKEKNAELYAITPEKIYTSEDLDYRSMQSRSSIEMKDKNSRPALKEKKDLSKYDEIYIGYPIWWNVAPRIINTFIEQANLKGKIVYPFATSGSSGIENSVNELKASYPEVKWQEGKLMKKAR